MFPSCHAFSHFLCASCLGAHKLAIRSNADFFFCEKQVSAYLLVYFKILIPKYLQDARDQVVNFLMLTKRMSREKKIILAEQYNIPDLRVSDIFMSRKNLR